MNKPSFLDRARYFFDNTMSRGSIALIGWLALLSAVVILGWNWRGPTILSSAIS